MYVIYVMYVMYTTGSSNIHANYATSLVIPGPFMNIINSYKLKSLSISFK